MKRLPLLLILSFLQWNLCQSQALVDSLIQSYKWRNIGPANQGGRIVDIEAQENDFTKVVMATASGGVWKSDNAGTTWEPIFDKYETASIGDIAIYQADPNIIWVGTGEANNRNSVSWGNGVYKSTDGGKTFAHKGLSSTHQIARVVTHPTDPDIAFVAAIGHLWGNSGERGIFKTVSGGKRWRRVERGLPKDGKIGCTDLVMHPENPDILYAAFYERLRQPWTFNSGGPNGGIFKSTDGGRSWEKLKNGLPGGPTGRIGLAIYRKNPNILMALVEAKKSVSLDTPGSGIYRSEDGGQSWKYVNTYNNRPFYYSQIRINPHDDQRIYVLTTRYMVSEDGGETLRNGSADEEVHGDFHAMWLDPAYADRYYLGADKGISITHDHGEHFQLLDNLAIGQFYRIGADMRDPYYIYGGFQDNGMYGVPSFSRDTRGILNDHNWKLHWGDGQFIQPDPTNWRRVFTSMENGSIFKYDPLTHRIKRIQPNPSNIINYKAIVPDSMQNTGDEFRFNWTSPMFLSKHDPQTLYVAGNYLFKTNNDGKSWRIISPDLSSNAPEKTLKGKSGGITLDNTGAETHCAVYTFSESPMNPSVLWVGTDDGLVQLTKNDGQSWTNVRPNIPEVPEGIWVSRVEASHFVEGRAYVTFDGHRSDQFAPWIFRTDDFGQSWTSLSSNLPGTEVIRVVREDLHNPKLLFIGTETGIWASVDGGKKWVRFMNNLPTVSVLDLLIHPRDNDLIAGTHGRSLWVVDNISGLQQLNDDVLKERGYLFKQRTATIWENTSRGGQRGHFLYAGENPSTIKRRSSVPRAAFTSLARIDYYLKERSDLPVTLKITDGLGNHFLDTLEHKPGIHSYHWDLTFDPEFLTEEQATHVESFFDELLKQYSFSALDRAYKRYKEAKTPLQQRQAIQLLRGGYLNFELDDSYGVPKADPGVYRMELKVGDKVYKEILKVREDPLLKAE